MPKSKKPQQKQQHQHQSKLQSPAATAPRVAPAAPPAAVAAPSVGERLSLLRHTREQRYAAAAYERVTAFLLEHQANPEACKKYRSIVLSAPALIRSAGLAQALAFLAVRPEPNQSRLVGDLAAIVGRGEQHDTQPSSGGERSAEALLTQSHGGPNSSLQEYMLLTRQSLEALLWVRRFVQHHIADDGSLQHLQVRP